MIVPATFAAAFSRTVDLFRDPDAKAAQKLQFRALFSVLKSDGVSIEVNGNSVLVNGTPLAGAECATLLQRLDLHGVARIVIPADPPLTELFELLKALADQPLHDDIPTRLRHAGVQLIAVTMAGLPSPSPSAPPPSSDPGLPALMREAEPVAPERSAAPPVALGTGGVLRGEMHDVRSIALSGVPLVTRETPGPPLAATRPVAQEDSTAAAPAAEGGPNAHETLARLARNPRVASTAELLAELGGEVEEAVRGGRVERALKIVAGIARAAQQVPDDAQRRQYGITLKRIYTKPVLTALAQLVLLPGHQADTVVAFQHAGAAGVEVLLDLLVAAPSAAERQAVFTALTQMRHGADQIVHMLSHPQWFVVRNVAELAGALGLEEAVPALGRQLDHPDERVRKAVALALGKIGSRTAAEPLRRALRDASPEVRIQAAIGVGGRKASPLAMPLVVAMEEEKDEAVERELVLALGRIASPDAVQALIKVAQPGGRAGRKPAWLRIAAVEALRLAATPPAVGTLEGLSDDSDKEVRAAAERALSDLKRRRSR